MQRHGNASDVNKRITRYVGVGLYDDLTCEPDKTGLGLDDVGANSLLRALKYLVADGLGQFGGNARPEAVARRAQWWCLRDLQRGRERGGAGCHETYMRAL